MDWLLLFYLVGQFYDEIQNMHWKRIKWKNLSAFKHALNCCLRKMSQKYKRLPQGISYTYLLPMRTIKRLAIIPKSQKIGILLYCFIDISFLNNKKAFFEIHVGMKIPSIAEEICNPCQYMFSFAMKSMSKIGDKTWRNYKSNLSWTSLFYTC